MQEDRAPHQEPRRAESQRLRSILGENGKHDRSQFLEFTDDNFVTEVLDVKDRLVVLDFWAESCVRCKIVHESMLKIRDALPRVKFGRVNVDRNPELVRAFELKAIPHVVAFIGGDVVMEIVGDKPHKDLLERIAALEATVNPEAT